MPSSDDGSGYISGSDSRVTLKCWSKGSENLQQTFCMAFTVDFTVYNFAISCQDRKWFIQKRFSQFDLLDTCLNKKYPDLMVNIQRLPPKQAFGSLSSSLIAQRQKSLDAYLQSILVRPDLTMTEEIRDFVEMPADIRERFNEHQRHQDAARYALR
mmetsp:Transcript_22251/g.60798  ORF Transcript_22251/g.60798 Transcript_22251/m.60798 type:complete len:156 (-) Transcript_22251:70-537(-)